MVSKAVPQKEDDLFNLINQPIYQVLMLMTPEESGKAASDFNDLKLTQAITFAADIINQGNSKLEGIRRVGKEYGFDLNQVMAFGDSDNDLEMLAGVGMSVAMGKWCSSVKSCQHITASNQQDGIHKALEHFGVLASEKVCLSVETTTLRLKPSTMMDERTQEEPQAWDAEGATHRADFKIRRISGVCSCSKFFGGKNSKTPLASMHEALDKAARKWRKRPCLSKIWSSSGCLIDTLYFTYGSFVLMG